MTVWLKKSIVWCLFPCLATLCAGPILEAGFISITPTNFSAHLEVVAGQSGQVRWNVTNDNNYSVLFRNIVAISPVFVDGDESYAVTSVEIKPPNNFPNTIRTLGPHSTLSVFEGFTTSVVQQPTGGLGVGNWSLSIRLEASVDTGGSSFSLFTSDQVAEIAVIIPIQAVPEPSGWILTLIACVAMLHIFNVRRPRRYNLPQQVARP